MIMLPGPMATGRIKSRKRAARSASTASAAGGTTRAALDRLLTPVAAGLDCDRTSMGVVAMLAINSRRCINPLPF
jgi:hypothetical protein